MKDVLSLDDIHLSGKRVLYRVDINSPLHPETGAFLDDGRLRAIIPTLADLSESKVVILVISLGPVKMILQIFQVMQKDFEEFLADLFVLFPMSVVKKQ